MNCSLRVLLCAVFCVAWLQGDPALSDFGQKVKQKKEISVTDFPATLGQVFNGLLGTVTKPLATLVKNIDFDFYDSVVIYRGTTEVYGQPCVVKIREDAGKYSYVIELPKTWKFSTTYPVLKPLDGLAFANAAFVFSDHDYQATEHELALLTGRPEKIAIKKGFNLVGSLLMAGPFAPIAALIKVKDVILYGLFAREGKGSEFQAIIPSKATFFGDAIEARDLVLGVAFPADAQKPSFIVGHTLSIQVPKTAEPLLFSAKLILNSDKGMLEGTMLSDWQAPLGLKVKIKEGHLNASYLYDTRKLDDIQVTGKVTMSPELGPVTIDIKPGNILKKEIAFIFKFPQSLELATHVPGLELLDGLSTTNPILIMSTFDYTDKKLNYVVKTGLNYMVNLQLSGPLAPIGLLTKSKEICLAGSVPKGDEGAVFKAALPGEISFGPIATAKNLTFVLKRGKKGEKATYTIDSDLSFSVPFEKQAFAFTTELAFGPTTGTLSGTMKGSWKNPLGIQGLEFENLGLKATLAYETRTLTGVTFSGGMKAEQGMRAANIELKGDMTKNQYSIVMHLPSELSVSTSLPVLKALDGFTIEDPMVIYSSWEYTDAALALALKKGLNFSGTLLCNGPLAPLKTLTGMKKITIAGVVPKTAVGTTFSALIPGVISFGPLGKAENLSLQLALEKDGAKVGIGNTLALSLPGVSLPKLSSTLFLGSTTGTIEAKMIEPWKNPLGIKGLEIKNVSLDKTTFTYSTPTVLTRFGIAGQLAVGNKSIAIAGASDIGKPLTLVGSIENIYLADIIGMCASMLKEAGAPINVKVVTQKIPNLGFKKAEIYIVEAPTTIAGKSYDKGFSISADARLLGKDATFLIRTDDGSIEGAASIDSIDAGIFKLTGIPENGKPTNPAVHVLIGKKSNKIAELYINGDVTLKKVLGGMSSRTRIDFSAPANIDFLMEAKLADLLALHVLVTTGNALFSIPTEFLIEARIQQNSLNKLSRAITDKTASVLGDKGNTRNKAKAAAQACKAKFGA